MVRTAFPHVDILIMENFVKTSVTVGKWNVITFTDVETKQVSDIVIDNLKNNIRPVLNVLYFVKHKKNALR